MKSGVVIMEKNGTGAQVQITAKDGHGLTCWMQPARGERRGGLVILQEIFGVTDQLKGLARRYAGLGYDIAVPALFDRQHKDAVFPFDTGAAAGRDLMLAAKLEETMADIEAAVEAVRDGNGRVAVIGFCWGGGLAVRAAQTLDIAGAVAFYGTRLPQYLDRPLKSPLLCHFGTQDDHVPKEMLDQFTTCFPEAEIHLYEAGHAFANDARPAYVPEAAELAHERTKAFLDKIMS
jgi:carboxymethylenebutenolidase